MGERLDTSTPEKNTDLQRLLGGIAVQAALPPDGDQSIGNLFTALHNQLPGSPLLGPLEGFAKARKTRLLDDNLGTVRSVFTVDGLLARNPRAPHEPIRTLRLPQNVGEWEENMHELGEAFADRDLSPSGQRRVEQFLVNLYTKDNQASTESRYTAAAWIAAAYDQRWPQGARILDIGAATRQGVNSFALKGRYGLHRATIIGEQGTDDSRQRSAAYNRMIREYFHFRSGVAVDALDIHTEDDKLWPISNLRHETELNNPTFMRRYLRNASARPRNVSFAQCDFSSQRSTKEFLKAHPEKFHEAIMSMMLHQNAPDDRRRILRTAYDATVKDDGVLVVQDRFSVQGTGLYDLKFEDNWFGTSDDPAKHSAAQWTVAHFDKARPKRGWQVVYTSPRSRFEDLRPADGTLAINGHEYDAGTILDSYAERAKRSSTISA